MKLETVIKDFIKNHQRDLSCDSVEYIGKANAKAIGCGIVTLRDIPTISALAEKVMGNDLSKEVYANLKINMKDPEKITGRAITSDDITDDGFIFVRSGKFHVVIMKVLD